MKRFTPILIVVTILLAFYAYPIVLNNLWSISFIKGIQGNSLTPAQLLSSPQSHPHARLLQARVAMSEQDNALALQLMEPLLPTTDPVVLQTYAELLFTLERFPEAIDIWHRLDMFNKIEHAASVLNGAGNLEMTIYALQKAYDIRPHVYGSTLLGASLAQANILRDEGKIVEAIPLYETLIDQFPDSEKPLVELAQAYLQQGDTELAVKTTDRAILISSPNYQFYMRAGSIYEQCGFLESSLETYQKALRVCPNCQDAILAIERVSNP